MAAKESLFVSTVVSYSLVYDATDVVDSDNFVTALEAQIQISIALIGMDKKPSIDPIVLVKRRCITLRKPRKLSKLQLREGLGLCSTPHC